MVVVFALQIHSLSQRVPLLATSLTTVRSLFRAPGPCLGCSGSPVGLSVPRLLGTETSRSEALETSADIPELTVAAAMLNVMQANFLVFLAV